MILTSKRTTWLSVMLAVLFLLGWPCMASAATEPSFPTAICQTLTANKASQPAASRETGRSLLAADETSTDTSTLQTAVASSACQNKAVRLTTGSGYDAFLLGTVKIPANVSIIVDPGVLVFASRTPTDFGTNCGTFSKTDDSYCTAMFDFSTAYPPTNGSTTTLNGGIYGFGVIDGRGWATVPLSGTTEAWWQRTLDIGSHGVQGANGYIYQNNPKLVSAQGDGFTLYKITLRNSPFWNVVWDPGTTSGGYTAWGIKVQAPWNIPNTDGMDIDGPNAYVYDSVISVGDDDIAIEAQPSFAITNVTIDTITAYGRNGISIGSAINSPISNVTVSNVNLISENVSYVSSTNTVNGWPLSDIETSYPSQIVGINQLMPSSATNIRGLNIKTNNETTSSVSNVTYDGVCMKDIVQAVNILPYNSSITSGPITPVSDITYQNIHIVAPDDQMVNYSTYATPPQSEMLFNQVDTAESKYGITLYNVYAELDGSGSSSLGYLLGDNIAFTAKGNVYPAELNDLGSASHTYSDGFTTSLSGSTESDSGTVTTSSSIGEFTCPSPHSTVPFPFFSVDMFVSVGSTMYTASSITLPGGTNVKLTAMAQPAMSQVGFYAYPDYGYHTDNEGMLAVNAPAPTAEIQYQLDNTTVSSATLYGNGNAPPSSTITIPATGTHTLTAWYPGDSYYAAAWKTITVN